VFEEIEGHLDLSVGIQDPDAQLFRQDEHLPAGNYRADFDARDDHGRGLPSGLYFYRLEAGGAYHTRKMILMR